MENTVPLWIPKYIDDVVAYRPGMTPKADEFNSWFNLLIDQGNWTADQVDILTKFCNELEGEFASLVTRIEALEASIS